MPAAPRDLPFACNCGNHQRGPCARDTRTRQPCPVSLYDCRAGEVLLEPNPTLRHRAVQLAPTTADSVSTLIRGSTIWAVFIRR